MTSVLLQPRCDGVDGVGLSTLRDFTAIKAAGYDWVSLYLGGTYAVQSYAIEAAWAAGLAVMLNYERTPDAAKGGYPAGKQAAETAVQQGKALGFLGEAPIPFSAADKYFPNWATAGLDYHQALVDVMAPQGWTGGGYGYMAMLNLLDQQPWWSWPLWHWGGDGTYEYSWAWAKQWARQKVISGVTVDENTLLKPMKFWSGYGPDAPTPPKENDVLTLINCSDAFAVFSGDMDAQGTIQFVRWVDGRLRDALIAAGAQQITRKSSELGNMTLIGPLPNPDSRVWTGSEFFQYQGASQGPKGDKGDPGPPPHGTFPAQVTIP